MQILTQRGDSNLMRRVIFSLIILSFLFSSILPAGITYAQVIQPIAGAWNLPAPGTMVRLSPEFVPALMQGMIIHPENPLVFDFIVNTGDQDIEGEALKKESEKLIKYFLASLTVPEKDLWVNLSPYEKDQIVPENFGKTTMGMDLLAEDYILKQLSASLMYPEDELGKKFWDRVYKKAYEKFGKTEIPLNTFNKIWIVPESATVYQNGANVFVVENHLKVMLEEDYLAREKNLNNAGQGTDQLINKDIEVISGVTSDVVRVVLIPEIEKEVNNGKAFANLRQIFNSMLLATWYKRNLKETILSDIYVDKNKTAGVEAADRQAKEKIYDQYVAALQKGVFNYIREDYDPTTKQNIPRKYFSGGATGFSSLKDIKTIHALSSDQAQIFLGKTGKRFQERVNLLPQGQGLSASELDKWQDETIDELIRAAVAGVGWIQIKDWQDDEQAKEAVRQVEKFLEKLQTLSEPGADKLLSLFKDFLAESRKNKDSQDPGPQLRVIRFADGAENIVRQALGNIKLPVGHASDRGIYLFQADAGILVHEFLAYLGMEHPQSVAFEMLLKEFPLIDNLNAGSWENALANKDVNFHNTITADGYSQWGRSLAETFKGVISDEKLSQYVDSKAGRPKNLLAQMSQGISSNDRRRDVAQFEDLPGKIKERDKTLSQVLVIFQKADSEYAQVRKDMANPDPEKLKATEQKRMQIVDGLYKEGKAAKDWRIAMMAYKKVLQMQPLMRHAYGETVRGSDFTLAEDTMPQLMSEEKAAAMNFGPEYIESLDRIKNARQLYVDAFQNYMSQKARVQSIGEVAVENILYGLGISAEQLFWGVNEQSGRSAEQLLQMAVSLREILFADSPEITNAMKAQAAAYLEFLFSKYLYNGRAAIAIDQAGGLTVPPEVYRAMHSQTTDDATKFKELKDAEYLAFGLFLFDVDLGTSKGHSLSALGWLANIYHSFVEKYYQRQVAETLEIEMATSRPAQKEAKDRLEQAVNAGKSLDELIAMFDDKDTQDKFLFPRAGEVFRKGGGLVTEMPVRIELSAGGIQDSALLSTYMPEGYNVLNLAGQLTREDGTLGQSISVAFEIRDLDQMLTQEEKGKEGDKERHKPFVVIDSLDMGWKTKKFIAEDILQQGKDSLVIEPLVSLGLFPEVIMKKAKELDDKNSKDKGTADFSEGKKALEAVLEKAIGKDKGLYITLHVRDITSGSGLAISSLLSMGVATAFDYMVGETNQDQTRPATAEVVVNQLSFKAPEGDYQIEVSLNKDFSNSYLFNSRSVNDLIQLDLISSQLAGPGTYYVRRRKVEETADLSKNVAELADPSLWGKSQQIEITDDIGLRGTTAGEFSIQRVRRDIAYMDDLKTVGRAISNSQATVLRLEGKAGTQDEVSGAGGVMLLTAGPALKKEGKVVSPGGIVPEMTRIQLGQDVIEKLEKAVRVLRVGLSESAEDTLSQVFINTILSSAKDQRNAWGQLTSEMVRALVRGDIVELGRLANAAVPLRERMAPVSIDPIVLKALERIKWKYGKDRSKGGAGFSYGITGARSTGSVLLFFDPTFEKEKIDQLVREVEMEIGKSIDSVGALSSVEEQPHAYKEWQVSARGGQVRVFDKAQMQAYNQWVLESARAREKQKAIRNKKDNASYTDEEIAKLKGGTEPVKSTVITGRPLVTMDTDLANEVEAIWRAKHPETHPGEKFDEDEIKRIKEKAVQVFNEKYVKFEAPGVDYAVREKTRQKILEKLQAMQNRTPKEIHEFLNAVLKGEVNLWTAEEEEGIRRLKDEHAQAVRTETMRGHNVEGIDFLQRLNQEIVNVNLDIAKLSEDIEKKKDFNFYEERMRMKSELANLIVLRDTLLLRPNPESLPPNHFLFKNSTTYGKLNENKIQGLNQAMEQGAVVLIVSAGGKGSRFFGGSKVKHVAPFHSGFESDASYLKLLIRRWAEFLNRFPTRRGGFLHVALSAFTEDAIMAVLSDLANEAGLNSRNVASVKNGLREPVWPTEVELALDLARQTTDTAAGRAELEKKYGRILRQAKKALEDYKNRVGRYQGEKEVDPKALRAPYREEDLNELNAFNPGGNAGSLETILTQPSPVYTFKNLVDAGYEIDNAMMQEMLKTEGGAKELREGMPLAKAALLVKGDGLSIGVIQQGSSRASIGGGSLAVADAIEKIKKGGALAVSQYTNMAGGTNVGGILVMTKEGGYVTTLEGQRGLSLEEAILNNDHTAIATGTVFLALKKLYQVLGYDSPAQYLLRPIKEITDRMNDKMNSEWESLLSIKGRTQEQRGQKQEWLVVQSEANLQWALTWMQRHFVGDESRMVRYQEVSPNVAYMDDKEREELYSGLERASHYQGTPVQTMLPPGKIEEALISIREQRALANLYWERGMFSHAAEIASQAKRVLNQMGAELDPGVKSEELKRFDSWETKSSISHGDIKEAEKIFQSIEPRLLEAFNSVEQNYQELSGLDDQGLDQRLNDLKEWLLPAEYAMMSGSEDLSKVLMRELSGKITEGLLPGIIEKLLIGYTLKGTDAVIVGADVIEETLARYGIDKGDVTQEQILIIQKALQDLAEKSNRDGGVDRPRNPIRLAYLRYEFTALFNQAAERKLHLKEKKAPSGMRLDEHKVMFLIDKDATIEDSGTVLKQITSEEAFSFEPHRALEFVKMAIRGARFRILTGSTTREAWEHVLEPIAKVLNEMKIPAIMKKMAILRLKVLSNDGTIIQELEMGDANQALGKPLQPNKKFVLGSDTEKNRWEKAGTIKRRIPNTSEEDLQNRITLWEVSVQAYLSQYLTSGTLLNMLGENNTEPVRKQILDFVNNLELRDQDIKQLDARLQSHQTIFLPLSEIAKLMLKNWDSSKVSVEATKWKERFEKTLGAETEKNTSDKLLKPEARVVLKSEELIFAGFFLIHFKESAGTYGSLSGDPLDNQNKKDGRVLTIKDVVLNRGFWERVKNDFDERLKEKNGTPDFRDERGNPIQFTSRNGPGYLNLSFGGVSKKNYISGVLQDESTRGNVIIIAGDSVTDQGEFPFVSKAIPPPSLELSIPEGLTEAGLEWNKTEKVFEFKGILDQEKKQRLDKVASKIQNVQSREFFQGIIEKLYAVSQDVHARRVPIRILLGTLFELNDREIERYMAAGLVRTYHRESTPNPLGDGYRIEKWGPVGFYPIAESILREAGRGYVIPMGEITSLDADKDSEQFTDFTPLAIRDRVLRGMIDIMNKGHVKDFAVIVPETMRESRQAEKDRNREGRRELRGIFLKPEFPRSYYDDKMPLPEEFIQKIRNQMSTKPSMVREILREAKDKGRSLIVSGYLRGFDGAGTMDINAFRQELTSPDAGSFDDLPAIVTIASSYKVNVRIEWVDNPDEIVYEIKGALYVRNVKENKKKIIDHEGNVREEEGAITDAEQKVEANDVAAFILWKIFGLSGIKVTMEGVSPMSLAGGIDSANNGFTLALLEACNILTGTGLSQADIMELSIKLENYEFKGLTGGSGNLSTLFGGVFEHIMTSGIKIKDAKKSSGSSISVPLLSGNDLKALEEHMLIVQAGKEYKSGQEQVKRLSIFINGMWMLLLRDKNPEAMTIFEEMKELSRQYREALKAKNFKTVAEVLIKLTDLRGDLVKIWLQFLPKGNPRLEGKDKFSAAELKEDPARDYWDRVFIRKQRGYELIRNIFYKEVEKELKEKGVSEDDPLREELNKRIIEGDSTSDNFVVELWKKQEEACSKAINRVIATPFYTYDKIGELVAAGKKEGIAIVPSGQSGPGANLTAVDPQGVDHLKKFLQGAPFNLREILSDDANRYVTGKQDGILRGFTPLVIGTEPMQFIGFEEMIADALKEAAQTPEDKANVAKEARARIPDLLKFQEITADDVGLAAQLQANPGEEDQAGAQLEEGGEPKENLAPDRGVVPGGINLNPVFLELHIKRDEQGMPLPVLEQPMIQMNINGFVPVIINIVPVANMPFLLGIANPEEKEKQAKHILDIGPGLSWFDNRLAVLNKRSRVLRSLSSLACLPRRRNLLL